MLDSQDAMMLAQSDTEELMRRAAAIRDQAFGPIQTWSPKVFIPLTNWHVE